MSSAVINIGPQTTMHDVLQVYPGAQRALFKRYHIGGCSSCAFHPQETIAQLCERNGKINEEEVIDHLKSSHAQDEQMQISPCELSAALDEGSLKLLDIRTREEWDAVRITGAVRMSQETMQEILSKWPRESLMVIYDHTGKRSLDAAAYFQGHGFKNVRCLRGGIDAWAQEIDTALPRYRMEGT
jgi:rhodanese-related sulfurtransferase